MRSPKLTPAEQYDLILECRSSGLSDYQWCQDHDINPSTFYTWVGRLRGMKCYDIPPPASRDEYTETPKQDIAELEILPESAESNVTEVSCIQTTEPQQSHDYVIEITFGHVAVRATNEIAPALLARVMHMAGKLSC